MIWISVYYINVAAPYVLLEAQQIYVILFFQLI